MKVQYPEAADALLADLRQLALLARTAAPLVPGVDLKPLVAELQARAVDELDYSLEAEAQHAFAEAFRTTRRSWCPTWSTSARPCWSPSGSRVPRPSPRSSRTARRGGARPLRRALRAVPSSGPARTGMLTPTRTRATTGSSRLRTAARPAGVLDFGAVARLPERGLPEAMASAARRRAGGGGRAGRGAAPRGVHQGADHRRQPPAARHLAPFVEPTKVDRFRFSREWMRTQFARINDPRNPAYTVGMKLNLPPSYLLIHRTWLAGVGAVPARVRGAVPPDPHREPAGFADPA